VILISEIEQNREKELEQRLRREITEEFKKGSRRKKGLRLSGIGGILYLLAGIIFFISGPYMMGHLAAPLLITGAISLMGTIIGAIKIKIGGTVVLISIPISILISYTLNPAPYFGIFVVILMLLNPMIFFHSGFVIIGGILCLLSSDK